MQNFKKFINYVHEHFVAELAASNHSLNVVMGNESCDLDSNMGSLTLAYLLSLKDTQYDLFNPEKKHSLHVPILSFDKEIYRVAKHENNHFIGLFGMNLENTKFNFLSEYEHKLNEFLKNQKANVTLFDHNEVDVDSLATNPNWNVVNIIDHHKTGENYKHTGPSRIVTPLGSATSLLADEISKLYKDHKEHFDQELLQFVSGPIINDTKNFKDKIYESVWVDLDEHGFKFLKKHSELITKEFRKTVKKYKDFIGVENEKLDVYYNLRRDFKTYTFNFHKEPVNIGFSTVVLDIDRKFSEELEKDFEGFHSQISRLLDSKKLNVEILKTGGSFVVVAREVDTGLFEFVTKSMLDWKEKGFTEKQPAWKLETKGFLIAAMEGEGSVKRKELVPYLTHLFK